MFDHSTVAIRFCLRLAILSPIRRNCFVICLTLIRMLHSCLTLRSFSLGLSKAETQALCNYGSGEDENEVEEIEEFEAGPVEVQTSLQANMDNTSENRLVC